MLYCWSASIFPAECSMKKSDQLAFPHLQMNANLYICIYYISGSQTFCARGTLCYLSKLRGTLEPECRSFLVCTEFSTFFFT